MNEYEIKARGKPPHKRQRAESVEQRALSREQSAGSRKSKFRLTGRDGPPGSFETTSGVPAWLARGAPVQYVNAGMLESMNAGMHKCWNEEEGKGPYARGKPPDVGTRVILTKERSVALKAESNRFPALTSGRLIPSANGFGMPFVRGKPPVVRDRGHPPELNMVLLTGQKNLEWEWYVWKKGMNA